MTTRANSSRSSLGLHIKALLIYHGHAVAEFTKTPNVRRRIKRTKYTHGDSRHGSISLDRDYRSIRRSLGPLIKIDRSLDYLSTLFLQRSKLKKYAYVPALLCIVTHAKFCEYVSHTVL